MRPHAFRSPPLRIRDPLHLDPILVGKPWGGRRLAELGCRLPAHGTIGESWQVADLWGADRLRSTAVACGAYAGQTLGDLSEWDPHGMLGGARSMDGRFPLLVKLLDAREPLSVQVHPTAAYAAEHAGARAKTETWVVLDADPGAQLYLGVLEDVEVADLRKAAGTPGMVELLGRVPARPGDVHHIPAGTIHALGGGIVVAEVQTPADTTFRLYDWHAEFGRTSRELHLEAALACAEDAWHHNVAACRGDPSSRQARSARGALGATPLGVSQLAPASGEEVLVDAPAYAVRRYAIPAGRSVSRTDVSLPRVVQVLSGGLDGDGLSWALARGGTVLLPAAWSGELWSVPDADGPTIVLETEVRGDPC